MRAASAPIRFARALALSAVFIFSLFWLLQALISGGDNARHKTETLPTVDFVRLNKAFEVETRERKPPKAPDKPEAPPENPAPQETQAPVASDVPVGSMKVGKDVNLGGFALSASDGEYLPIIKVDPVYPSRAQSRGLEGWVLLKFTVTETGAVRDPVIIESDPPGIFDEAARKAVLKFKYKPRMEGGRPVAVPNVQHLITFKIEKNGKK